MVFAPSPFLCQFLFSDLLVPAPSVQLITIFTQIQHLIIIQILVGFWTIALRLIKSYKDLLTQLCDFKVLLHDLSRRGVANIRQQKGIMNDGRKVCLCQNAQIIDDVAGNTLCAASTAEKEVKAELEKTNNVAAAACVGTVIAKRALEKGIKQVVFDRGGYIYHGKVQALADAAREAGLDF